MLPPAIKHREKYILALPSSLFELRRDKPGCRLSALNHLEETSMYVYTPQFLQDNSASEIRQGIGALFMT
jgi:hypothetical protein